MKRARKSQEKQVIQDIPLKRAKKAAMMEPQLMKKPTIDTKKPDQGDTSSTGEEIDETEIGTKRTSIPIDSSYLKFGDDFITFSVNKVKENSIKDLITGKDALQEILDQLHGCGSKRGNWKGLGKVEDWSMRINQNIKTYLPMRRRAPAVVNAFDVAWNNHHHLSLSPSDFIIMIGQGLAYHINKNAEKLRKNFVDHKGKEQIVIRRDDLRLGEDCDWSTIFGDFSKEIKKRVKSKAYDVVIDDTSVTTPVTRIVSEIILMDCYKAYYNYVTLYGCGFPKITLRGTPDDWKKLLKKVEALEKMNEGDKLDLNWWLKELVPVVRKICEAGIERKIDRTFWSNAYIRSQGYLEEYVGGWIHAFLPYFSEGRNESVLKGRNSDYSYNQQCTESFFEGVSRVSFLHVNAVKNTTTRLEIYAGFLGGKYDKSTKTVRPHYFWCIAQHNQEEEGEEEKSQSDRSEDS